MWFSIHNKLPESYFFSTFYCEQTEPQKVKYLKSHIQSHTWATWYGADYVWCINLKTEGASLENNFHFRVFIDNEIALYSYLQLCCHFTRSLTLHSTILGVTVAWPLLLHGPMKCWITQCFSFIVKKLKLYPCKWKKNPLALNAKPFKCSLNALTEVTSWPGFQGALGVCENRASDIFWPWVLGEGLWEFYLERSWMRALKGVRLELSFPPPFFW